ncbi:MAG: hypothetical protein NTV29_12170 [Planctomycetota bacterium]|nr:hypothetical protein [Planctomycetota bacterium]
MKRPSSSVWLVDLAIGLLGFLVMMMVLRVFRFDDPRVLYNAWTYCLAIPTVIVGSTMLAHVLIPQSAERSIQAGFLLSVLMHLGLTVAAINTVLFSGIWKDGTQEVQVQLKNMSQGSSFLTAPTSPERSASDYLKPDYLRPVPSAIDPASQVELRPETPPQQALELIDSEPPPSLDSKKQILDQQLAQQELAEPQLTLEQAEVMERPLSTSSESPRQAIQIENVIPTALAQAELPQMQESKAMSLERPTAVQRPSFERATMAPVALPLEALPQGDATRLQIAPLTAPSSNQLIAKTRELAEQNRLERELDTALNSPRAPASEQALSLALSKVRAEQVRPDRLNNLPGAKSPIPIDSQTSETAATAEPSPLPSIGDLIGDRAQVARRDSPSSGVQLRESMTADANGSLDVKPWKDSIVGRIASAAPSPTANADSTTARLPSLSDPGGALPGLDQFRPANQAMKGTSKGLVPIPAAAFEQRMRRMDESSNLETQAMGPLGPKTEEAIEKGLAFLAKYQRADGSWKLEDFGQRTVIRSDTAATALSLLSFQGAGYSHVQYKYQQECRKALAFLIAGQQSNGDLYRPMEEASDRNGWLYSHAIATLALCEAYGMTQDENLRSAAQRAVDFLVYSQDRQEGGWRYIPRVGSDTSVTGWGMMALKSAELSGLYVPKQTFEGIEKWLEHSQVSLREQYLYRYNWLANTPETKHGALPTPVMTSVGLLMRLYMGWKRDNIAMAQGADWLLQRPPAMGTEQAPKRDTYYWYYATQVLFHMGEDRWKNWYQALYPLLIESQVTQGPYAGSWEPNGPIPDAWGEYAGRLYVTSMNLLSLEVTYRHLPIYEATSR